jgi:phage tail sheath protein FI
MATARAKTFPGVYTTITDQSFLTPTTSRFRVGLIGVASKGPLNTPTQVLSLKDFRRKFGSTLGAGFYLADAASILSDLSDGTFVLRVAHEYAAVANCNASGNAGTYKLYTPKAPVFDPTSFTPTPTVYLRVSQTGLPSTVDAVVVSGTGSDVNGNFITLRSNAGDPALAADYTTADVAYSLLEGAANNAESVLYAYGYKVTPLAGTISGNKSDFQLTYTGGGGASDWTVGAVYKIVEANLATTLEIRVKQVLNDTPVIVQFETSDISQTGYQAVALQDSYSSAKAYQADPTVSPKAALYLMAATPGTWANGEDPSTGLYTKVRPGSAPGSKKIEVYEDSSLFETFDNLVSDSTSANFYEKAINGVSAAITVAYANNGDPANTAAPWDSTLTQVTTPKAMPTGPINNGQASGTHGSFDNGANGANITDADIIGTVNTDDDSLTGIQAFEATDQVQVDFLCAPGIQGGNISVSVEQEITRVANLVNAMALVDIPAGLTAREAVDWHNGAGLFRSRGGRINSRNLAVYWNWFTMSDRFSTDPNNTKVVPPTLGALRCEAFTFANFKPWMAAAGFTRGLIPEALSVAFPKISEDVKESMYGNGQSVNPILLRNGQILLWGERTMQVAESKLSVVHSNVLIHYIVDNMSAIGQRFVFDPNDAELLTQLKLVFTEFLDTIKNERGIEDYNLVIDQTNNTPDSRNRREVNVDLFIIPVDSVERIYINAIVRESGANLQTVTG